MLASRRASLGRLLILVLSTATAAAGPGTVRDAHGQTPGPATELTLEAAIERALTHFPGLEAAGLEVDIERARRNQAGLSPPLTLAAEIENFAGSGAAGGFDASETTLQLGRVVELGGKRGLRLELGNARIARAELELAVARLELAAEVTRRFLRVAAGQARVALAADAVDTAAATAAVVRARVEVGRTSEAELATAEVALAEARIDRDGAQAELGAARFGLALLSGRRGGADLARSGDDLGFVRVAADVNALPALPDFAAIEARLADNPELARLARESRALEAERRLAAARARPDLSLALGVRHLGQSDDSALTFSVGVPLGSRTRAAPLGTESAAAAARNPFLAEQRRLDLLASLYELRERMATAAAEHAALRDDLVPRAADAVELYRQGFEIGSHTLLELSQSQSELLRLEREALAAAERCHAALIEIEWLLGGRYAVAAEGRTEP